MFDDYLRMYANRDDSLTTHFSDDFSGFTGGGDFLVKDKAAWVAITSREFPSPAPNRSPVSVSIGLLEIVL